MDSQKLACQTAWLTIAGNIFLSLFKFFAGIIAHSSAMLSDAVHSLSDVLSTLIVLLGIKLASKAPDREHPFGHERMECVAALVLAAILFGTGAGIGYLGIVKVFSGVRPIAPGALALTAAAVSIAVKELMFWYTRGVAKKLNSGALMADAWHHRSDAFSSVGSFAGILGARLGFPILDPIASVVISLLILRAAVSIFQDSISKMMDTSCDDAVLEEITAIIWTQPGVLGIDRLATRLFGNKIYVELEIRADGCASLWETHAIAQEIHDQIERELPAVKHCMVHVSPDTPSGAEK